MDSTAFMAETFVPRSTWCNLSTSGGFTEEDGKSANPVELSPAIVRNLLGTQHSTQSSKSQSTTGLQKRKTCRGARTSFCISSSPPYTKADLDLF